MHNLNHYIPDVDENGVVQGLYGLVLDLTERRDAELRLARSEQRAASSEQRAASSEQRLRTITDNPPVMISYIDEDERYQFCNGTCMTWMGIESAQVVGSTMTELLGPDEYAKRAIHLRRTRPSRGDCLGNGRCSSMKW
jgi:PAS domain-containing protein